MTDACLKIAVPDLGSYGADSGIGRVLLSLKAEWGEKVEFVDARFRSFPVPLLRGYPYALRAEAGAQLVFMPRIMGATALRRTGGLPSLIVVHDVGGMEKKESGDRSVNAVNAHTVTQHFWAVRHATHVVTVSEFTKERLLRKLPVLRGRVSVIHNGVAETFSKDAADRDSARRRAELFLGSDLQGPCLIYVGSESPRKNVLLLLQALGRLKAKHPQARLIKIGRPDHPSFRSATLAALGQLDLRLERDVFIREAVDDESLRNLYKAADVFVSASLYEGFCLPAVEAMALGTPVVVSNRGALPEVVGGGGMVVEPSLDTLVPAIAAMLDPETRALWAKRGKARAAGFDWARGAEAYLATMRRLAKTPERARPPVALPSEGSHGL